MTAARWDDASAAWTVTTVDREGTVADLTARAVISAVGQLNRPKVPDLPGRATFAGPAFHSAEWGPLGGSARQAGRDDRRRGERFQIAPAIADDVAHLTVFQRTAQWMFPNPNYHADVGPGVRWALRHLPFYGR